MKSATHRDMLSAARDSLPFLCPSPPPHPSPSKPATVTQFFDISNDLRRHAPSPYPTPPHPCPTKREEAATCSGRAESPGRPHSPCRSAGSQPLADLPCAPSVLVTNSLSCPGTEAEEEHAGWLAPTRQGKVFPQRRIPVRLCCCCTPGPALRAARLTQSPGERSQASGKWEGLPGAPAGGPPRSPACPSICIPPSGHGLISASGIYQEVEKKRKSAEPVCVYVCS